jgi:hypothetical protein
MRARKAAQYANSIDDVINIFLDGNNGGYAMTGLLAIQKQMKLQNLNLV